MKLNNFKHKFKQDLKFRAIVILLSLILVSVIVSQLPSKKEAGPTKEECHSLFKSHVSTEVGAGTTESFKDCQTTSGCYAESSKTGEQYLFLGDLGECISHLFLESVAYVDCTNGVKTGGYVFADQPNIGCESGESRDAGSLCRKPIHKCIPTTPGQECNNDAERDIAEMVSSLGITVSGCKNRYYIGIFGGGFLAMTMLGAII